MGWIKNSFSALFNPRRNAATHNDADDFWYQDIGYGQSSGAGINVTPDIAVKASAVYACVKVLAETIATLPLQMQRQTADGGHEPAPNHPIDDIIRFQPNDIQTAVEFWETIIFHAALRGAGYAEIIPGPRGPVDQLKVLPASWVTPQMLPNGSLRFDVQDRITGRRRVLLQEEVFRIPGMSSDGMTGMSAVDLASEAIGIGMAADQYAARVFSQKMNVGGILVHPGRISTEAQKKLIQRMMDRWAGVGNMHSPMILQEGMDWKKTSMDANEAQLLDARKWQISEIARFWRIPLHMLGIDDQTNRSTVEEQSINFVKYTIRPWVRRIEQAIRRDLITAKGLYEAKFNLDGLQRGNLEARANYWSKALGAGGSPPWMTQNEVRVQEGLNRIDDPKADKLAIATNPGQQQQQPQSEPPRAIEYKPTVEAAETEPTEPEIEDKSPEALAARLVRIERKAILRAVMRHGDNGGAIQAWLKAFYGGHVSAVMSILGIPKIAARAYCDYQRDEALKADDLVELVERRDETLADEIAATLRRHGGEDG